MNDPFIRCTHPYGFRSGTWARLRDIASLPGFPEGDRSCYLVEFGDGVTDFWAVTSPDAGYEFLAAQAGCHPGEQDPYDPVPDLALLLASAQRLADGIDSSPGVLAFTRRLTAALRLPGLATRAEAEAAIRAALRAAAEQEAEPS